MKRGGHGPQNKAPRKGRQRGGRADRDVTMALALGSVGGEDGLHGFLRQTPDPGRDARLSFIHPSTRAQLRGCLGGCRAKHSVLGISPDMVQGLGAGGSSGAEANKDS